MTARNHDKGGRDSRPFWVKDHPEAKLTARNSNVVSDEATENSPPDNRRASSRFTRPHCGGLKSVKTEDAPLPRIRRLT